MPAVAEKPDLVRKKERIDLRVPAETKELIRNAAEMRGMNTSDFIITAAYDAAQSTIIGREIMQLDREQSLRVIESLTNLGEPNEALKNLMRSREPAKELVP